jgi:hypothetical protein
MDAMKMKDRLEVAHAAERSHSESAPAAAPASVSVPAQLPIVQRKLTVGPADDKYEREADQAAQQVMRLFGEPGGGQSPAPSVADAGGDAPPAVEQSIESARGGGQSLSAQVRHSMEQAFGTDFGGVRVHTDPRAHAANQSLSARAFTTGQDIFFREGEYNTGARGGQELLAHELAHVVQQGGKPALQPRGIPLDADAHPRGVQRKLGYGLADGKHVFAADYPNDQLYVKSSRNTGMAARVLGSNGSYQIAFQNREEKDVKVGVGDAGWFRTKDELKKYLEDRRLPDDSKEEEPTEFKYHGDAPIENEPMLEDLFLKGKGRIMEAKEVATIANKVRKIVSKPYKAVQGNADTKGGRALSRTKDVTKALNRAAFFFPPLKLITVPIHTTVSAVSTVRNVKNARAGLTSGETQPLIGLQNPKLKLEDIEQTHSDDDRENVQKAMEALDKLERLIKSFEAEDETQSDEAVDE